MRRYTVWGKVSKKIAFDTNIEKWSAKSKAREKNIKPTKKRVDFCLFVCFWVPDLHPLEPQPLWQKTVPWPCGSGSILISICDAGCGVFLCRAARFSEGVSAEGPGQRCLKQKNLPISSQWLPPMLLYVEISFHRARGESQKIPAAT